MSLMFLSSKLLERIIASQLVSYLDVNNLLPSILTNLYSGGITEILSVLLLSYINSDMDAGISPYKISSFLSFVSSGQ